MDASLRRQLVIWLLFTAVCVFGMIVIGGLTRLTGSGLSIVEWKLLSGILPPLTEQAWFAELEQYRATPQYQHINKGMSLEEFKGIFWLEYWHRIGGRAIGFVFLLPMLYFFLRYQLPRWVKWRVAGIFVLGGMQGFMGWYMVKSGLIDVPHISQYRLALHLGLAFILMAACVWVAREIWDAGRRDISATAPPPTPTPTPQPRLHLLSKLAAVAAVATFAQVLLGALVAGLNAGLVYNTFPLMDGRFIPNGLYLLDPAWINHFDNVTTVQFQHRIGAYVLTLLLAVFTALAWPYANNAGIRTALVLMMGVLLLQIALGIATLVYVVPIVLASKHQAVAAILFALTIWVWYDFRRLARQSAENEKPVAAGVEAKWQTATES